MWQATSTLNSGDKGLADTNMAEFLLTHVNNKLHGVQCTVSTSALHLSELTLLGCKSVVLRLGAVSVSCGLCAGYS